MGAGSNSEKALSPPPPPVISHPLKVGVFRPDEHFNESTSSSLGLFVLAQAIYTTLTILPPILTWYACHEVFGTAWLVFLFAVGAWNGGSYYVEIFSKRFLLFLPFLYVCSGRQR